MLQDQKVKPACNNEQAPQLQPLYFDIKKTNLHQRVHGTKEFTDHPCTLSNTKLLPYLTKCQYQVGLKIEMIFVA